MARSRICCAAIPSELCYEAAREGGNSGEKGEFLDRVHDAVLRIAETELPEPIFNVAGCPWVDHWVDYYRTRSADELEDALVRYAPAARDARSAQDAVAAVCDRVRAGIVELRRTGSLPDQAIAAAGGAAAGAPVGDGGAGGGSRQEASGGSSGRARPLARRILGRSAAPQATISGSGDPQGAMTGSWDPRAALDQLGPGSSFRAAERRVAGAFAPDVVIVAAGVVLTLRGEPAGTGLTLYVSAYAVVRFVLEPLRGDPLRPYWLGVSEAQWTSVLLAVLVALAAALGVFPGHWWDTAAAVGLAGGLVVMLALARRPPDILHPRHLQEVVRAVARMAQADAAPSPQLARTSAGVQLSCGRVGDRLHVAISGVHEPLDRPRAQSLAGVIGGLRPDAEVEYVAGAARVWHVLMRG
ncbi:MAG: hypothetical protein ACLP01_18210 [Solirubrobacteraceae bacterium]